jgi:hypothetical protein
MVAMRFEHMGPNGKAFAVKLFLEQCWNQQSETLKLEGRSVEMMDQIMAYFMMKWSGNASYPGLDRALFEDTTKNK